MSSGSSAARSTRRTAVTSSSRARAKRELGLDRLLVLVVARTRATRPSRRRPTMRLRLARAAFPDDEVVLDEHAAHGRHCCGPTPSGPTRCS